MPKRYPEEFRRKVLDLVACGRPVAQIAADLSVSRRSRPSLSHGPLHFLGGHDELPRIPPTRVLVQ